MIINGPTIAFFIMAALILSAAVFIVTTRNIMHAVFVHLMALSSVGGIYVLLYAQFIAAMQVLIYAGAVTTMVLFALMLVKPKAGMEVALDNQQKGLAFATAAVFLSVLLVVLVPKVWATAQEKLTPLTVAKFGKILFTNYVLPFEMISVLLLVALIGVLVLASKEEE